jgi:hypothetical protein
MSARADLCGGRSAMIVPTATVSRKIRSGNAHWPEVANPEQTGWASAHLPSPGTYFRTQCFGLYPDQCCVYVGWVGEVRLGWASAIVRGRISSMPTTNPVTKPPKWAERSVVLVMDP